MICPIRYNPVKYDRCYPDCALCCITSEGYCCAFALMGMQVHNDVKINFEKMPDLSQEYLNKMRRLD